MFQPKKKTTDMPNYDGVPRFSSSFRTDPSRKRAQNRLLRQREYNNSFIDREVLERSTDAVLKIVHPGRSEQQKQLREEQREHIRNHVLQTMKPRCSSDSSKLRYTNQCLPQTEEKMTERKRKREERVLLNQQNRTARCLIELHSDQLRKQNEVVGGFQFSFDPPKDITSKNCASKERQKQLTKHVSFVSPEKETNQTAASLSATPSKEVALRKFPVQSFCTPARPLRKDAFSKPPPLIKPKRNDVVILCNPAPERVPKPTSCYKNPREEKRLEFEEPVEPKENTSDNPGDLQNREGKETCEDGMTEFERELNSSLLRDLPESEPYDLLGLGSSLNSKRFTDHSFF